MPTSTSDTYSPPRVPIGTCLVCVIYCALLLVKRLPDSLEHIARPLRVAVFSLADQIVTVVPLLPQTPETRNGLFLFVAAAVIPWLALVIAGRARPGAFGLRAPNVYGWRILCVGTLAALPFLWWMATAPDFARHYLDRYEQAGVAAFVAYYLTNMASEHFLIHGAILTLCRPGRSWPPAAAPSAGTAAGFRSALQWVGLAHSDHADSDGSRLRQWLGLPPGCAAAIITSSVVFALVHYGKHPRELILSIPGGLLLAYIAYRTNSWLVPLALHLATASITFGLILIFA